MIYDWFIGISSADHIVLISPVILLSLAESFPEVFCVKKQLQSHSLNVGSSFVRR